MSTRWECGRSRATIAEVPPAKSFRLGSVRVEFPYRHAQGVLTLLLDPNDLVAEITERNNRVESR